MKYEKSLFLTFRLLSTISFFSAVIIMIIALQKNSQFDMLCAIFNMLAAIHTRNLAWDGIKINIEVSEECEES